MKRPRALRDTGHTAGRCPRGRDETRRKKTPYTYERGAAVRDEKNLMMIATKGRDGDKLKLMRTHAHIAIRARDRAAGAAGSSYAVLTAYIHASRVLEGPLAAAYTIGARRTRPGQNKTRAQRAGFPSGARPLVAAVTLVGVCRSRLELVRACVCVGQGTPLYAQQRGTETYVQRGYTATPPPPLPLAAHPAPPPRPTNRAPRAAAAAASAQRADHRDPGGERGGAGFPDASIPAHRAPKTEG